MNYIGQNLCVLKSSNVSMIKWLNSSATAVLLEKTEEQQTDKVTDARKHDEHVSLSIRH